MCADISGGKKEDSRSRHVGCQVNLRGDPVGCPLSLSSKRTCSRSIRRSLTEWTTRSPEHFSSGFDFVYLVVTSQKEGVGCMGVSVP